MSKEQYDSIFSSPGNKVKDMPNTWEVGTEYSWGSENNKIYGQRFIGNISANQAVNIINTNNKWHFVDVGGEAKRNNDTIKWQIVDSPRTGSSTTASYGFSLWIENIEGNPLRLVAGTGVLNCTYDLWILYTKDLE